MFETFQHYFILSSLSLPTCLPVTVSLPTSPVSLSSLSSLICHAPSSPPLAPPRPPTPDLGIPMEMTPGQIMEAEISATLMDNPESPFQSGSLISDDQSLHDHVFSVASPGPNLDSDFDQVIETSDQSRYVFIKPK